MNNTVSSLLTQQYAISVTSRNIVNATTDGYTRETVVFNDTNDGTTASAKRVYDTFLTNQLVSVQTDLGKYTAQAEYLGSIEGIFAESEGSGLSEALSEFWSAWQDLADNPTGTAERSSLVSDANTLAGLFNSKRSSLSEQQQAIDDDVADTVAAINEDIRKIAALNQQIAQVSAKGQDTGSLQDNLETLVKDLASLTDITTYTGDNGQISINLTNGSPLVQGTTTWSLGTATNATTGLQDVTWIDDQGNAAVITSEMTGGKLGGELEVRDETIPSYLGSLDTLAATLIEAVNDLHTTGYDLNGDAGTAFFSGTTAADMAVSATILADAGLVAASDTASAQSTDGSIATAIAALQESLLLSGGTATYSDFYSALVTRVGTDVEKAGDRYDSQSDTVTLYQNLRDSVSAVSTDEEQTKLLAYQSVYQASAKLITVLDEMLETILEM